MDSSITFLDGQSIDLKSRFSQVSLDLSPPSAQIIPEWADAFLQRYSESQRHYHTLAHIASMLQCFDQVKHLVRDPDVVQLAILFHDWVYEPGRPHNESDSIDCFKQFSEVLKLPGQVTGKVVHYIQCTITHTIPTGDEVENKERDTDLELFLDFDLEVLSRSPAEYNTYADQIRREHGYATDDVYCKGRCGVLRSFLARERIYFSDYFWERGEKRARANLEDEITILERKQTQN